MQATLLEVMPGDYSDAVKMVSRLELDNERLQTALAKGDLKSAVTATKAMTEWLNELYVMAVRKSSYSVGLKARDGDVMEARTVPVSIRIWRGDAA